MAGSPSALMAIASSMRRGVVPSPKGGLMATRWPICRDTAIS